MTVLILGDSISAAYGLRQEQGWVTLLGQDRISKNANLSFVNSSISGETTAGALSRIDEELEKHQPNIVIVELGGNDGLRGLPPKLMKQNLSEIIQRSQKAGAKIILLGMRLPPNYGKRYADLFASVFYQLAEEYNIAFVPFLLDGIGTNKDLMQHDGIHPNAKAQPILMKLVRFKLEPLLRSTD